MSNRHLSRSIVMQSLFECDFNSYKQSELDEILERNIKEFAPGVNDLSFLHSLLSGVVQKTKKIDEIIVKAAPDWPIEKISTIDRNILRIGLYELLFGDRKEVPPKVAINEAIELAKTFGGEASSKFVNGVLGAVYKELGEPGKSEVSKKKHVVDTPYEKMPIEKLGGAVVYAKDNDDVHLAFVHDIFGHWTLSKGRVEKDESVEDGTKREIKEELGVEIEIKEPLGSNEYIANDPEIGKKRKQVNYFLGEAKFGELTLGKSGGLDDAKWFKLSDVGNLNIYDDILPIITKAINILLKNK
jgi:N utilization substance protein B